MQIFSLSLRKIDPTSIGFRLPGDASRFDKGDTLAVDAQISQGARPRERDGPFFPRLFSRLRKWRWWRARGASSKRPRSEAGQTTRRKAREKPKKAKSTWPNERLFVVDRLWGDDCTVPGGAPYVKTFISELSLSKEKSLLLLGAGLGGVGRTMVEETGVWVSGLEHDRDLAALGKAIAARSGMQKRAPVTHKDFNALKLKERAFNAVVSFETLYIVEDKAALFATIDAALRPLGTLLFTDLVIPDDAPEPGAAMHAWARGEPHTPHPARVREIVDHLGALGLNVDPPEDVTADYRRRILKGWSGFLGSTNKAELSTISQAVVSECALWVRRVSAIDEGGLRLYKFRAAKKADSRLPPPL